MHTQVAAELLMRLPMMAGLTEGQSLALAVAAKKCFFKNGEVLIEAGSLTGHLFIILSGRANDVLSAKDDKDDKKILIATLGIGECLGEMSALDEKPHCTNVVANGPVQALMLKHTAFNRVLRNNPQVAINLLKAMLRHTVRATRQIMWLTTVSVRGRVAPTAFSPTAQ